MRIAVALVLGASALAAGAADAAEAPAPPTKKSDASRSAAMARRPAPAACLRTAVAAEAPRGSARASQQLAEGIALFEQGRLVPAFHNLNAAVGGGLADPVEIAMAHKYLAFYYCVNKARVPCERHMEAALLASPGFDLSVKEKQVGPWIDAYESVYRRLTVDCTAPTVAGAGASSGILDDQPPSGIRQTSSLGDADTPAPSVLRFSLRPWGNVYLNGKRWLTSPPVKEVQLAPGRHRIEVRNGKLVPFATEFTFAPGGHYLLRHDF